MYSTYTSSENTNPVQYLGYTTNNIYPQFPPLMSDGRTSIASWQPEAIRNNELLQANHIQSNSEYRQYLTKNADQIRKLDMMQTMNDVGYYKRYADTPGVDGSPYLYKSYMDKTQHVGYSNSDLKDLYISREQLNARKVSPVITQEELLKTGKQR